MAPRSRRQTWQHAVRSGVRRLLSAQMSLVAAGCAFYATLALFPAISMLVFLYGLVFDPVTVEPQLRHLRQLVPPSVFALVDARVLDLVRRPRSDLSIGLAVSTAIAAWSATTGTKAMLSALNVAFGETERRGIITFQLTAMVMTLGAILIGAGTIAALVVVPAVLSFIAPDDGQAVAIRVCGALVLMAAVLLSIGMLYRFGPSRHRVNLHWITPGALVATVLWIAASLLFSLYVGRLAGYDAAYGPLAAAVGVMMWFWVSAYVVLIGAQIDAGRERLLG
jgi:membrane protein